MANRKPNSVLVIGTGTIGEPLVGLLADIGHQVGIDEVLFHKHSARLDDRPKVANLMRRGAQLCVDEAKLAEFKVLGHKAAFTTMEALARATVVIDCTPKGWGKKNKLEYYRHLDGSATGFIAQGSEFGFGKMYVHGVNDEALVSGEDRYIQVVSCNTHNLAVLIHTIALAEGRDNLVEGQFVCMRRANDISQDSEFVAAPTVTGHDDERFGTHHARDAYHLFQTLGLELNLFSSAILLNTQYMHTIWFDLQLKRATTLESVQRRFSENPRISLTHKTSANLVFSFGRDHGHYGRLLNNTVVCLPSLHVSNGGRRVRGFCFTPQDGNALLSSIAATLWFLDPSSYRKKLEILRPYFFNEV
jgi:glyceraldehyde-3-phosphate dehydrogenase (NAD(P))